MIARMSFVSARTFYIELITKDAMNAIGSCALSLADVARRSWRNDSISGDGIGEKIDLCFALMFGKLLVRNDEQN